MHRRPNIDFVDGIVLEHARRDASEEVEAAVAKENAIDDAIHFFHHLLDARGRPHGVQEVDLVGVDPFVWVVDWDGALALHSRRQRVVLLAEECQLHLARQEVLHKLIDKSRSDRARCACDNDVHAHVIAGEIKIVGIYKRGHITRLRPQVLYPGIVNLPGKDATQGLLYPSEQALEHGLLLGSAHSLILLRWLHCINFCFTGKIFKDFFV